MKLTVKQREAIGFLLFLYGNAGPYYTAHNQRFLHLHSEGMCDEAMLWVNQITDDCRKAFDKIAADDYSGLSEVQQERLEKREHWRKVAGIEE